MPIKINLKQNQIKTAPKSLQASQWASEKSGSQSTREVNTLPLCQEVPWCQQSWVSVWKMWPQDLRAKWASHRQWYNTWGWESGDQDFHYTVVYLEWFCVFSLLGLLQSGRRCWKLVSRLCLETVSSPGWRARDGHWTVLCCHLVVEAGNSLI